MPLSNLITKLSQVSLSDINHELGKAKESLVYESGNYIQNFKSDASHVGSLIRSESMKFGSLLGTKEGAPALPKSTSMPVIQNMNQIPPSPDQECKPCSGRVRHIGSKYKYRSNAEGQKSVISPQEVLDEESIVNKFITVVDGEESSNKKNKSSDNTKRKSLTSREDIRKKLASFGEEETIDEEDEEFSNNNLEICFINDIASDDEEIMFNPLSALCEDNEENENEVSSPDQAVRKNIDALKAAAAVALSQCKQVSSSLIDKNLVLIFRPS